MQIHLGKAAADTLPKHQRMQTGDSWKEGEWERVIQRKINGKQDSMGWAIYGLLVMCSMQSDLSSLQVSDVHPFPPYFTIRHFCFAFSHDIKCKSQTTVWWVYLYSARKSAWNQDLQYSFWRACEILLIKVISVGWFQKAMCNPNVGTKRQYNSNFTEEVKIKGKAKFKQFSIISTLNLSA